MIRCRKTFDKNLTPILDKSSQKARNRGKCPQLGKERLQNLTANTILNCEKQCFPPKMGTRK